MRRLLKVGTRGSALAQAQTRQVLEKLQAAYPDARFKTVLIRTSGDRITSAAELRRAGKGLFVKEIERALLKRSIDLAIHSAKDLPSDFPQGLTLGAVLEREDASDLFVGRTATPLENLPPKSEVGTSSLRRQAFVRALYRNLIPVELRGNLDTRIEKLRNPRSKMAGIIVAAAGVKRLFGETKLPTQILPKAAFVPAGGQGILAVEIREKDLELREWLEPIHHPLSAAALAAEREVLRLLEGGCQVPLGVHAEAGEDGLVKVIACLASLDGARLVRASATGSADDPRSVAEAIHTMMNNGGADEILESIAGRGVRVSTNGHRNGHRNGRKPARPKRRAARRSPRRSARKARSKSRR